MRITPAVPSYESRNAQIIAAPILRPEKLNNQWIIKCFLQAAPCDKYLKSRLLMLRNLSLTEYLGKEAGDKGIRDAVLPNIEAWTELALLNTFKFDWQLVKTQDHMMQVVLQASRMVAQEPDKNRATYKLHGYTYCASISFSYTKDVYTIPKPFVEGLLHSDSRDMSFEEMMRLPNWGQLILLDEPLYMKTDDAAILFHGFSINKTCSLHYNFENPLPFPFITIVLSICDNTQGGERIEDWTFAIQHLIPDESHKSLFDIINVHREKGYMDGAYLDVIQAIVPYFLSEKPDIEPTRDGQKLEPPVIARFRKRSIQGFRFIEAPDIKFWKVGSEYSRKVETLAAEQGKTTREITSHMRRGHWHGFWTGPRSGTQLMKYKWLPPTVVRGKDFKDLPT